MESEDITGPVHWEGRVPTGTRVQIDIPMRTSIVLSSAMFAYSGYFLYHTLKGYYNIIKETKEMAD